MATWGYIAEDKNLERMKQVCLDADARLPYSVSPHTHCPTAAVCLDDYKWPAGILEATIGILPIRSVGP